MAELEAQLAEEKYHTEVVETIMKAANQVIAELEAAIAGKIEEANDEPSK